MSQQNVEIVRLAYAAFSERDLEALRELTAPDFVLDFFLSIGPQKGIYRGREESAGFLAPMCKRSRVSKSRRSTFAIAPGGEIVVRHHQVSRGRASGVEFDNVPDVAFVYEFRNGKVTNITLYQPCAVALEAMGLRE